MSERVNNLFSCSFEDWKRLKQLLDACSSAKNRCNEVQTAIQQLISEIPCTSECVSQVQNKEILLRVNKTKLEETRNHRRVLLHLRLREDDSVQESGNKRKLLNTRLEDMNAAIIRNSEKIKDVLDDLRKFKNELIYRRRFMLDDLYMVYFVDDCYMRYFKKKCNCIKYDLIYGLHLPSVPEKNEHSDNEICASISHLVNLLICVSKICDYPLKYPVIFKGSSSSIIKRSTGDIFEFQLLILKNRTKFVEALRFLSENIVQFRADCGLRTTEPERIIPNLRETLLSCVGRYAPSFDFIRPNMEFRSVASLIPLNLNPSNIRNMKATPPKPRNEFSATSILDVVTASPSNFITARAK
ncbi:unnamed protein product [Bursaphelenchus xylophilus]|uniref:(pine wood nematode) hypothetical protein n=1 Tax=Bursaphelenchus xylophilus TaxID=6326 RepID=A0A1I7SDB7_BURXY|nr:unnamed protein product [Bursaphelenchus xylophilus]CAG9130585.1 unnamed protein product [Bursaphelenchus xylophilus]